MSNYGRGGNCPYRIKPGQQHRAAARLTLRHPLDRPALSAEGNPRQVRGMRHPLPFVRHYELAQISDSSTA